MLHVEILVRGIVEYALLALWNGCGYCRVEGVHAVVRFVHLLFGHELRPTR